MKNSDPKAPKTRVNHPVGLVAGGPIRVADFRAVQKMTDHFVAADGGAAYLLARATMPDVVYGDMDSLAQPLQVKLGPDRIVRLSEQETTDFDKALRHIEAPLILVLGALGGRVDHELAVFHTLLRHVDKRCLLVGHKDVLFACPAHVLITLDLRAGDRLSLFPMCALKGKSEGLDWPIDGLSLDPMVQIGTSNRVTSGQVRLFFEGAGMLVILPRTRLTSVAKALVQLLRG